MYNVVEVVIFFFPWERLLSGSLLRIYFFIISVTVVYGGVNVTMRSVDEAVNTKKLMVDGNGIDSIPKFGLNGGSK